MKIGVLHFLYAKVYHLHCIVKRSVHEICNAAGVQSLGRNRPMGDSAPNRGQSGKVLDGNRVRQVTLPPEIGPVVK